MTTRKIKALQKEFLRRCVSSAEPLEELFDDLSIPYETFVSWMDEREFRSRLHGMRRFLRKARDLQLNLSSYRAAGTLARLTAVEKGTPAPAHARAACVDVIRLARDSRARRRAQEPNEVLRQRLISHPDLTDEEASRLTAELAASTAPRPTGETAEP